MFVLDHLDDYDQLHMVSYEGPFTTDPKAIIASQLKKGRFDEDQFYGRYTDLGVGCTCNGAKGMECLLIFTSGAEFPRSFNLKPEFT